MCTGLERDFAISITSISSSQDILTVPLEDSVLLLLHLNDNVARLLPRLVVALPVENFPGSFNFENCEHYSFFINLSLSPGSILNSPEITWATFVKLDLNHLLLLCRLLALAPLTPAIYMGE